MLSKNSGVYVGADISLLRAINDRGVEGGPLYISLCGIEAGYGNGAAKPYRFSVSLGGGAAFLTVAGDRSSQTKTVPYAGVELFSGAQLGRGVYLGGAFAVIFIFDHDSLLSAMSPAFRLQKEF